MKAQVLEQTVALGIGERHAGGLIAQGVQHRGAMLGGKLIGVEALQFAGHLAGILADVGLGQGAIDDDTFGAFAGRHLLGGGRQGDQACGGQKAQMGFHTSPFW